MFWPIVAIFSLLQFCSKGVSYIYIYMSILRGDVEQNCNNLKMAAIGRNM